jgi:hypothetical protein
MNDRRKIKRPYLMYYANIYATQELLGRLVDLTTRGLMVICEAPVPVDKTMRLRLELSEDIDGRSHMEFNARSLWCRRDVDPQFHVAGFELLDLTPEDSALVERLVQTYAVPRLSDPDGPAETET